MHSMVIYSKIYLQHWLTGVEASNTTPYHPMGNGQCERINRSLVRMLKSLLPAEKWDWKSVLPKWSFAYNSTQHASTGFSPFYMKFGREVFEGEQVEAQGQLEGHSRQQLVKK